MTAKKEQPCLPEPQYELEKARKEQQWLPELHSKYYYVNVTRQISSPNK